MEKFLAVVDGYNPKEVVCGLNNVVTMDGGVVTEHFGRPCHAWMEQGRAKPMKYLADFSNPLYRGGEAEAKDTIREWDELLAKVPMCARVLYDEQTDFTRPYVASKTEGKYSKEMFFVLVLRRYSWERPAFTKRAVKFHKEYGVSATNAVMLSTFYQNAVGGVEQEVANSHIAFNSYEIGKLLKDSLDDKVKPLAKGNTLDVNVDYGRGIASAVATIKGADKLSDKVFEIYKQRNAVMEYEGVTHNTNEAARKFIGLIDPEEKGRKDVKMDLHTFITIADEVINGW